ncbi:MAG: hypothetical protein WCP26_12350 [Actinomycetes bacterium]
MTSSTKTEAWAAKILPTYEEPTVDAATGVKYQSWHIQAKFVQPLNFSAYPKTGYGMYIAIEDNTYDNTALVFVTPTGLETAENIVSPGGWSVSDPSAEVMEHTYNTNFGDPAAKAPISFSQANFNFVIERSDPTRLIKAILPIIIMAITLLAFLIPAKHLDARLLLTVTALISAVLLHDSAVGELPRVERPRGFGEEGRPHLHCRSRRSIRDWNLPRAERRLIARVTSHLARCKCLKVLKDMDVDSVWH